MARRGSPGRALVGLDVAVEGTDELAKAFADLGSRVRSRVADRINRLATQTENAGSLAIVSMTQTHRAKLANSLDHSFKDNKASLVSALVFSKRREFYILSRGSKKHETMVKPYTRRARSRDVRAAVEVNGKNRKRIVARGVAYVKGHHRRVNLEARPFLARAYAALGGTQWSAGEIVQAARDAMRETGGTP